MFDPIAHYSITPQARIRRRRGRERRAWCKDEILEAHRHGISIHRIAQIFRERKVDISTQHLMRAIRLFIAEEERGGGKASAAKEGRQGPAAAGEEKKRSVTYEPLEQISPVVREEEFAKQLRLARYLAGASLPAARTLEPAAQPRTPKPARAVSKARTSTKKEAPRQKAAEAELAKERRGWKGESAETLIFRSAAGRKAAAFAWALRLISWANRENVERTETESDQRHQAG